MKYDWVIAAVLPDTQSSLVDLLSADCGLVLEHSCLCIAINGRVLPGHTLAAGMFIK